MKVRDVFLLFFAEPRGGYCLRAAGALFNVWGIKKKVLNGEFLCADLQV